MHVTADASHGVSKKDGDTGDTGWTRKVWEAGSAPRS